MALTDKQVRSAQPSTKPYKLTASLGLYLLVKPNGSRPGTSNIAMRVKNPECHSVLTPKHLLLSRVKNAIRPGGFLNQV